MTKTSLQVLTAAVLAAGTLLSTPSFAAAQRGQTELVNRPSDSYFCKTDDGYGRWRHCSAGGE